MSRKGRRRLRPFRLADPARPPLLPAARPLLNGPACALLDPCSIADPAPTTRSDWTLSVFFTRSLFLHSVLALSRTPAMAAVRVRVPLGRGRNWPLPDTRSQGHAQLAGRHLLRALSAQVRSAAGPLQVRGAAFHARCRGLTSLQICALGCTGPADGPGCLPPWPLVPVQYRHSQPRSAALR